jgi:multimeric flavodoxin WrbA
MSKNSNLFLNFSEKAVGNTQKLMNDIRNSIGGNMLYTPTFKPCIGCGSQECSIKNCKLKDSGALKAIMEIIDSYDNIYFCFPVYLNMPTPKLMAFLSRLASPNDNTDDRLLFRNKNAYIMAVGDVSGTQKASSDVMIALNMLGFNLPPRCVYEHINNWQDKKIRGGDASEKLYFNSKKDFKTKTEI